MVKRTILVMVLMLLLNSIVIPVGASQVVDYNVSAFVGGNSTSGTSSSTSLSPGSAYLFGSPTPVGGYSIQIPPNEQSGYLIVAGISPIRTTSSPGSGWVSASSYSYEVPYYFLSTVSGYGYNPPGIMEPFSGIVYVPAHSVTLYLNVYGYNNSTAASYWGAQRFTRATIQFVADSGDASSDIVAGLQQVNQSIQNVYNEIQSSSEDNEYAEQLLDELQGIMDSIDELTQQIEDNTNRPPPDDIVPSMPPVFVAPSDIPSQDGRTAITDILASSILTNILIMVFSLAFLRYVLFGKSK